MELQDLPRERDEERLLRATGWETATIHLGADRIGLRRDLLHRPRRRLETAALTMADIVEREWQQWMKRA